MNLFYKYCISIFLFCRCILPAIAENLPAPDNNRQGLAVNVKYDPVTQAAYYDFNFLAEPIGNNFRTDQDIKTFIKAYPEMLYEGARVEKVKVKYPAVFEEAYKEQLLQQQLKEKSKRSSFTNNGTH